MHVFMSPAERSAAAALMWQQAMGTKDKQADESGWSVRIIPPVVNAPHEETQHTVAGYKATGKYTCDCHEVIIRQN